MNIVRAARHARLRLIIPALALALAVAAAALITPLSQIASAQATTRAVPAGGPKPTIVLEHGAGFPSNRGDFLIADSCNFAASSEYRTPVHFVT